MYNSKAQGLRKLIVIQCTQLFSAGAWLSFRVGQKAQASQANCDTPTERLDGLICVMADFHCQMELLTLMWKVLYNNSSNSDHGTLNNCKTLLNAVNITSEPKKDFYKHGALADKVTQAYVVMGEYIQSIYIQGSVCVANKYPTFARNQSIVNQKLSGKT